MGRTASAIGDVHSNHDTPDRPDLSGKLADLTVIDGDPLAEPHLLSDPDRIWLVLQLGAPVAGQLLANPALADQFTWPDQPAGPKPVDMAGWIQASRGSLRAGHNG